MTIKEVFDKAENGTLTYDQFTELTKDAKFADLATGDYVSKKKFDDELAAKDGQIQTLNGTIKDRDTRSSQAESSRFGGKISKRSRRERFAQGTKRIESILRRSTPSTLSSFIGPTL